jgi:hypothetical protein
LEKIMTDKQRRFVINILDQNGAIATQIQTNLAPEQILRYLVEPDEQAFTIQFTEKRGYSSENGSWGLSKEEFCELVDYRMERYIPLNENRPDAIIFTIGSEAIGAEFSWNEKRSQWDTIVIAPEDYYPW